MARRKSNGKLVDTAGLVRTRTYAAPIVRNCCLSNAAYHQKDALVSSLPQSPQRRLDLLW
jgi:hypothetical protein